MPLTRRGFLTGMAGAGALAAAPGLGYAKTGRPNFVFILIDDLRWNALGCTGHPFAKTPNIDRIGREGAIFQNAFCTTPLCSPSRGSFLTGQFVHTHGVKTNQASPALDALSHSLRTFPQELRKAGYETAYVGKWHMGDDDSPRPGFDHWVSFRGQGVYVNPTLNINGKREEQRGYMTDILSARAADFLKRPHTRPFALYLAHKAVHGNFEPAERHTTLYAEDVVKRRPNAGDSLAGKPVLQQRGPKPNSGKRRTGTPDETIKNQLRCMNSVDDGVGEILRTLQERKLLDNTLVIFTSDNGFFWGDHGLGDKRYAYDESIRIPLLMRCPALIRPGLTPRQMALNIDIAPTILSAAGVTVPARVQGESLLPILAGKTQGWRTDFLCEYYREENYPYHPTWFAVRSESAKYIHYPDIENADEFYDLRADPYELNNLCGKPAHAGRVQEYRERLEQLTLATGGPKKKESAPPR